MFRLDPSLSILSSDAAFTVPWPEFKLGIQHFGAISISSSFSNACPTANAIFFLLRIKSGYLRCPGLAGFFGLIELFFRGTIFLMLSKGRSDDQRKAGCCFDVHLS